MNASRHDAVLHEAIWSAEGTAPWVKRAILVVAGIAALAIFAKIKVPMCGRSPSPWVPLRF